MATHFSIVAWRIPWTEEPGGLHPWGLEELDTTERLMCAHTHTHTHTQKREERNKRISKNIPQMKAATKL